MTYDEARIAGLSCYGEWMDQVKAGRYWGVPSTDSLFKPIDDDADSTVLSPTVGGHDPFRTVDLGVQWLYEGHERYRALQNQ
jgi:hypothetical protein